MKKFNTLEFHKKGTIGILTLNREPQLNAINQQLLLELEEFLKLADEDRSLHVLILTGKGKAFAAGADIKEMQSLNHDEALEMSRRGQRIFLRMEESRFVTIAAINGFALGGGLELALACDMLIAAKTAKVGLPEVSLGLIPGYGGTQRLSRSIGRNRAKYMVLTGGIFSASEAYELGLFAQVVDSESLMSETEKVANVVASRAPLALSFAKRALQKGFDEPLGEGLAMEALGFAACFQTQDVKEGLTAFIEKRSAQFTGE